MRSLLLFLACLFFLSVHAQQTADTLQEKPLDEIVIRAFEQNRKLRDVPAAINFIGRQTLQRFGTASVVQAINTTPGVRMEERSPGSYRFNIRGSSSRSPFGVRNVKVYFNDLPITDPGGTTYLNQLGYYNFNSIEIIKGPGSSLYGAGTGGVVSIESLEMNERTSVLAEYAAGSFGLSNIYGSVTTSSKNSVSRAGFQHQQGDGYRDQSSLKRDVHSWTGLFRIDEDRMLKATFLYGNLFYETPGALNLSEYLANPKGARPGAVAANASIRQRSFLAGASYDQKLLPWLRNKSALYGMFTELTNPNLSRYEKSSLPHVGGRTVFRIQKNLQNSFLNLDLGGEWQQGMSSLRIFKNVAGNPDSLRSNDEINNRQSFIFMQASMDIGQTWTLSGGGSWNWSRLKFTTFSPASQGQQKRRFNNRIAPRVALMRKFKPVSVYASISKGFSPPSTAELLPSGGSFNRDLNAETGLSYDLGVKGRMFRRLSFDLTTFYFHLQSTIVQRRDAAGGNYFINAGRTDQKGIELSLAHPVFREKNNVVSNSLAWLSYTYHHFEYKEFKQLTDDFSGNALPGVSPHTLAAGFDIYLKNGMLAGINYFFSGKTYLNDANTAMAGSYHLAGAKLGYERSFRDQWRMKIIAGADNLLDEHYSLGNDVNGFGGRFYNAAATRNYYVSFLVQWMVRRSP